jgi:hypothetical protein
VNCRMCACDQWPTASTAGVVQLLITILMCAAVGLLQAKMEMHQALSMWEACACGMPEVEGLAGQTIVAGMLHPCRAILTSRRVPDRPPAC